MSPVRGRGAGGFSPDQGGPLFYDAISFLHLPRANHLPKDSEMALCVAFLWIGVLASGNHYR